MRQRRNGGPTSITLPSHGNCVPPATANRRLADHRLGQIHDLVVRGIGLVQLEHRELGVMPSGNAFVAEVPVDLIDAVEAADGQALEVQLRRHAQVQVHVERIVMRHERPRGRAAGYHVHHRRLDFHEAPRRRLEPLPHEADRCRAQRKHPARFRRDDQVDVTLAIALFDIGQAMPLVRQRPQRFRQQPQCLDTHRQLASARAHQCAFGADDVADIPRLERLVSVAERGLLQEQLQMSGHVLQLDETRLAHDTLGHQPAGNANMFGGGFDRRCILAVKLGLQVAGERVGMEVVRERNPARAQCAQLFAAFRDQPVFVDRNSFGQGRRIRKVGHDCSHLQPLSRRERGWGEGPARARRSDTPEPSSGASRHLLPMGEGKIDDSRLLCIEAFRAGFQPRLQARLDEFVEIAIEDFLRVRALDSSAQILYARLIEHIVANLAAPADIRFVASSAAFSTLRFWISIS
jgi:hypothetical protein